MNHIIKGMILGASFIGLGFSMPSCSDTKAMQQQMEALQTSNTELTKKVKTLSTQLTELSNDMTQVKQLLPQVTNVVTAQKGQLESMDASLKEVRSKLKLHSPKASKKK
ncbi:MAG: hypothetical protein ACO3A2_09700 [Bdellovibrionia bacterium]